MSAPQQILEHTDHRPWPLPRRPWVMKQKWTELLFLHYAVPETVVRPLVPASLPIDTFDGMAWVSIASFWLSELRMRWLPPLPFASQFLELNVRTYVTIERKPGVYFFSLDASSSLAVWGARAGFSLPYFRADMSMSTNGNAVRYSSRRRAQKASFSAMYRPTGSPKHARAGELDYFLSERYCLYAVRQSSVYRTDIHHLPWPLQPAESAIEQNTMLKAAGLGESPKLISSATKFARTLDVLAWAPERCA